MIKSTSVFQVLLISLLFFLSCDNMKTEEKNTASTSVSNENTLQVDPGLSAANDSLYAALNAMFTGSLDLLQAVWSHADYVTQMGPFGGRLTGWEAVNNEFRKVADMKLGGKIVCKDKHLYSAGDIGYVVCVEEGENISPEGKSVKVSHRATNIFHLENGQWKLIHHHTDISTQLENTYEELKSK